MQYHSLPFIVLLALVLLVPGAMAYSVSSAAVEPDILNPGDSVNVSCTVYAASGTSFSAFDDLQFVTTLNDPVWVYTIIIDDVENTRPSDRGKILTIGGYELSYPAEKEVAARVSLKGQVPYDTPDGTDISLITIQELDSRSRVISSSVNEIKHLVGKPTPTPTPEYGQVVIASEPAGANVYLDNTIRGITPMTIKAVPNGRHTVTLRLEGYTDYIQEITVTADAPQVNAVLTGKAATNGSGTPYTTPAGTAAIPATGTIEARQTSTATGSLSVTTSPSGALVYLDGQMKGVTPATIPGLSPGTHTIKLILDGYQDLETSTDITAGTTSEFVTGLSKRKQAPGFPVIAAFAALGLVLVMQAYRHRKH